MKIKNYLGLIFFVLTSQLQAQWTADTMLNTLVRDSSGTEEVTPMSATLSDGSTYISWFESNNGNYEMRMQLLDPNGIAQWAFEGLIVSSFPQNSALFRYDLKVDHHDNAILAFQDERNGGVLNIVAYKLDRNGIFLWGPNGILLADDHAAEGISPVIGITSIDNVIIAWNADSSSRSWVNYQKISASGVLLWNATPMKIIDSTWVAKYGRPSVVPADTDDFVMLFVRETGNFPYTSIIFAQHFDVNGNEVWPSRTQVSTKTIGFVVFPKAVSDLLDGFYVGINTSNPINPSLIDVYVQHVNSTGGIWSVTGTEASNLTTNHKTTPSLKFLAPKNEIWVLMKVQDGGQTMGGVSVQKLDTAGTVLLNPAGVTVIPVSPDLYESYDFESTGDGMIIFFAATTVTLNYMKAVKVDSTGISVWTSGIIPLSSVVSGKLHTSLGSFSNNQVVAVWEDQRIDRGIYAQNISSDGRLGILTGIQHTAESFGVSLYPNPSHDLPDLYFGSQNQNLVSLRIMDAIGKIFYSGNIFTSSKSGKISLQDYILGYVPLGIYFIELKDHSGSHVIKWVKQ